MSNIGIDIQARYQTVTDAKKQLEMLGTSLRDVQGLSNLGDMGFDPSQSERIKEMVSQVNRLNTIASQGERRGGFLDKQHFQEASRMMQMLTKNVQEYGKELDRLKSKHTELGREERQLLNKISTGGGSADDFRRRNEIRRQREETGKEIDQLQKDEEKVQKLRQNGMHAQNSIGGMDQQSGGSASLKKMLGWGLAAAGGFSILGFLSQSRGKYQQSVGHEATLAARGIGKDGWNDNLGIGVGPLEQAALLENISSRTGMSGQSARNAANMSGAFGRYAGVDPSMAAGMYDTMYTTTGNANSATGAMGMMTEAFRKGLDKAKSTELMTLISRNTQISAQAMAGTGANAGAATALAIEAMLAQNEGKSYGQYAKSAEFGNFMQNGMQDAGTPAGNAKLFSIMGGYDGAYSWQKMHQMGMLKEEGFAKRPDMLSKLVGTFYAGGKGKNSQEERAGHLAADFPKLSAAASLQVIKMHDEGFLSKLDAAVRKAGSIEKLKDGSAEEKKLYEKFEKDASSMPGVSKLALEATKEDTEIKTGERIHQMLGNIETGLLKTIGKVVEGDLGGAIKSLNDSIGPAGIALGVGVAGLSAAGVLLNTAGVALNLAAAKMGIGGGILPVPTGGGSKMPGLVTTAEETAGMASKTSKAGAFFGKVGKVLGPAGMLLGAGFEINSDYKKWSERFSSEKDGFDFVDKLNGMDIPREQKLQMLNEYRSSKSSGTVGTSDRRKQAMQFFMSKGFSKEQAAGIVGNLEHESIDLDPNRKNLIGMYGIAQWDTKRRAAFKNFKGYAIDDKSIDPQQKYKDQLDFVQHELETNPSNGLASIKKAKSVEEAATAFEKWYERSGGHGMASRIRRSKVAYTESIDAPAAVEKTSEEGAAQKHNYPSHYQKGDAEGLWGKGQFEEMMKVLRDMAYGGQSSKARAPKN